MIELGHVRVSGFLDEISPVLNEQFDVANELGIFDVELRSVSGVNVLKMTPEQHGAVRAELKKRGMAVSAIGSPVGKVHLVCSGPRPTYNDTWVRYDKDLTPRMRLEDYIHGAEGDFKKAVSLAMDYGAPRVRVFTFWPPEGDPRWRWRDVVLQAVNKMGKYVADSKVVFGVDKVVLGVENERGLFGNVGAHLKWLFDNIDCPGVVGAVLDPSNFALEGEKPIDAYRDIEDHVYWAHIKDSHAWKLGNEYLWVPEDKQKFALPGEGGGQIPEIMAKMRHRMVQGSEPFYCTMEPHLQMSDAAAGQTRYGGTSGPENFKKATQAFMRILDEIEIPYEKSPHSQA